MTDQPSMSDLKTARLVAGMRLLGRFLLDAPHDRDSLETFALAVKKDLTDEERSGLVEVLLRTFPADQGEALVSEMFRGAGYPVPSLGDDALADARFWAGDASPKEIKSYAIACFEHMAPGTRKSFAEWARGKI